MDFPQAETISVEIIYMLERRLSVNTIILSHTKHHIIIDSKSLVSQRMETYGAADSLMFGYM